MIDLVMVFHCHQPVGNFEHVFKMAFDKCYGPLLHILDSHPKIRVGLHFSGPLFEWMEQKDPECMEIILRMVLRNQIELLSGGFFEPLLATIPARDAIGQVNMMNDFILHNFHSRPKGFWLTERVWDPCLPLTLDGTGMSYTIVDDTHLFYSGLKPEEIYGYYITEKQGCTLKILSTPMEMRYQIPFKPVEEVIGHLKWLEGSGHTIVVYGDDGEKFGLWPGTYEWVIEKGWLNNFFSSIENNSEWLKTSLPMEVISSKRSKGRIYLPQASYEEMTEWALPTGQQELLEDIIQDLRSDGRWDTWRPFVRGGTWDNFLVKYPESNSMHKKMLFLSEKISNQKRAMDFLWRAQCNCAYWHGVFGGLYLGHLRRAIYENLIRCNECLIEESETPYIETVDLDKDGEKEILIWDKDLTFGLAPSRGGGLFEICHIPTGINLCDVLSRRSEAYHRKLSELKEADNNKKDSIPSIHDMILSKDGDLERFLVTDTYSRLSLIDHFLDNETMPEDYSRNEYYDKGDFVQGRYNLVHAQIRNNVPVIKMSRKGMVNNNPLHLEKSIEKGKGSSISIGYEFSYSGQESIATMYGSEFNLTVYSDQDEDRYISFPDKEKRRRISETGKEDMVSRLELVNNGDGLTAVFNLSRTVNVWFYPIMTVSQSEKGFELSYQGTSILFLMPLILSKGEKDYFEIKLELF